MAIHLRLINHDEKFNTATTPPIIVNEFDLQSQNHLDRLNDLIYTTYSDDSLEVLPRCDCGELKGVYNVGLQCSVCNTFCLPVTERPLESALWIAAPKGVDALINPEVWIILDEKLTVGGISILQWLTNPTMQVPPDKTSIEIDKLTKMGMPRGLNHFYQNFDEIMDTLINGKVVTKGRLQERQDLLEFLQDNREAIFSKHIPIPSKLALITEKTPMGGYVDPTMASAVEAVRTISSVENSITPLTQRKRESRTVRAIMQLADFYQTFFRTSLNPKEGWPRKHIYGSRTHFSFRAVISSISEPHHREEVHMPWSMSVMWLKIHLVSKLLKRGYTPSQAIKHIYEHTLKYSIELDEIFQELIAESPGGKGISLSVEQPSPEYQTFSPMERPGGVPILLQRNPSLTRGSIQQLTVSKIQTDPSVNTIRLSVLILASFNADFDGDQLNGLLVPDKKTLLRLERHRPHLYAMDLNKPHGLAGYLGLPAPVVANIAAWVHGDTQ